MLVQAGASGNPTSTASLYPTASGIHGACLVMSVLDAENFTCFQLSLHIQCWCLDRIVGGHSRVLLPTYSSRPLRHTVPALLPSCSHLRSELQREECRARTEPAGCDCANLSSAPAPIIVYAPILFGRQPIAPRKLLEWEANYVVSGGGRS
jgi:hypothetical protein